MLPWKKREQDQEKENELLANQNWVMFESWMRGYMEQIKDRRNQEEPFRHKFDLCMEELKYSSYIETLGSRHDIPYLTFIVNEYDTQAWYLVYRDEILASPKNHTDSQWCQDDDILVTHEEEIDSDEIIRKAEKVIPIGKYVTDKQTCLTEHWSYLDRATGGACRECTNIIQPGQGMVF